MAQTALNDTGRHSHITGPLAPQPSTPRGSVPRSTWPIPIPVPPQAELARMWLAALAVSADKAPGAPGATGATGPAGDIPMDMRTARRFLTRQSAALVSILLGSPFRPRQAAAVGHALVKADFVGADVLGRSLRVLILRLPALLAATAHADGAHTGGAGAVGDVDQRVAAVTEALANGYVRALRDRTLAEQESIRRAELAAQQMISERLRHQALHDSLTGLANRAAAFDRLSAALAAPGGGRIGLCYLDLDDFKAVNDRYGHDAGDELLVSVAERIGRVARDLGALAARIGGDEFIVLAESSPGERGMVALAAAILAEVRRPVSLRIGWVGISACAGIVECAPGSPAAATVVANADAALYQAKSQGPGRWAVFGSARRQAL
jgi:diguanylate cyclase